MPRELYIDIGDTVSRVVAKIKRSNGTDFTLVLPKGAMLLTRVEYLKTLRRAVAEMGKNVSIMTMDPDGQKRAEEAGFSLVTFEMLRKGLSPARKPAEKQAPKFEPAPAPVYTQPKITKAVEEPAVFQHKKAEPIFQQQYRTKKAANPKRNKWLAAAVLLVIFALLFVLVLPTAAITITPHAQPLTREMQISVDQAAKSNDSKNLIIPGKLSDKEQQLNKTYSVAGKQDVGIKAKGSVQIFNYTGRTLKFNAATTTLTVGSKVYRLEKDISGIKPTRNLAGTNNADPSSLTPEVSIVAEQPGEQYNLPAKTRFEIHNQVLGDVPTQLYALNTKSIDGGLSRFTSVVTQEDLDKAAVDVKASLFAAAKQQFLNSQGLVLLESGASVQASDPAFDKKVGDTTVSLNAAISGRIKALLFKDDDLKNIIRQRILMTLDKGQTIGSKDAENWELQFKSLDLEKGVGVLNVKYSGTMLSKIDLKAVREAAKGKSAQQFKDILMADPTVDSVDVRLKPFWISRIPMLTGRIDVKVASEAP